MILSPLPSVPHLPSPQVHLTNHVASLNSGAGQDMDMARGVYHDYKDTIKDMVEAGDDLSTALEKMGDSLVKEAKVSFLKVVEKKEDPAEVEDGAEYDPVEKSELKDDSLIFNLEDEGFGEGSDANCV